MNERLTAALAARYRIERELGAGGMATVYLAEDLKHDRKVAIKVLHPDLAAALGGERFLAEIKTTARLQHPHILPLLDSGTAEGLLYYVMPFVAGETLRDRLTREVQLPVADALRIAREVADALSHAHGHGIIHRDIKPENVLLQGGHALVADFGIALAVQQAGGARMTQTGLSLGTPQYMAPEQAMGEKTIDARADVYALGAVTYEMLAGAPPFTGPTVQAIVARILTDKPVPLRTLRESVPEHVEDAVLASLAKLPADRLPSAEEFGRAIAAPTEWSRASARTRQGNTRPWLGRPLVTAGMAGLVAGLAAGYALWNGAGAGSTVRPAATFVVASLGAQNVNFFFVVNRIAASPDGRWCAFVASGPGGGARVYLRSMDDLAQREIAEGFAPAFSPDSRSLAYGDDEGIMVVPVAGGVPSRLVRHGENVGSISWGSDGRIRYASSRASRYLFSVAADGTRDSLGHAGDTLIARGEPLPGDRLLLSLVIRDESRVAVRERDGRTRFLLDGALAHVVATGHLVLTRRDGDEHVLYGVRFDPRTAELTGSPEPLARGVSPTSFAVSTSAGDLMYLSGRTTTDRQVVVVDRSGNERLVTRGTNNWVSVRLGTNRRSLVTSIWDGEYRSIWVVDVETGAMLRLTRDREALGGVMTPDGKTVYFTGPGSQWIWKLPATGGTPVALETPPGSYLNSLSRDGSVLWLRVDMGTQSDLWRLPLGGAPEKAVPVLVTPANEQVPVPSPDGRWLAYRTNASGRDEAVLAPISSPGTAVQISTDGGSPLGWSDDGRRLFYRQRDEVWEVSVAPGGAVRASAHRIFTVAPWLANIEITPDGAHLYATRGGMIYSDLIVRQGALK